VAPFDFAFIDADKGYVDYLGKLLPRIGPRGLLLPTAGELSESNYQNDAAGDLQSL
jgi:hypothetical protein